MATICGSCGGVHSGTKEVKECYAGKKPSDLGQAAMDADSGSGRGYFPDKPKRGGRDDRELVILRPGLYRRNGKTYKVRIGGTSGVAYASVRIAGSWRFAPGAIKQLRETDFVEPLRPGEKGHGGPGARGGNMAKISKAGKKASEVDPEAGMYRHPKTLEVLKVYKAVHGSGKMVAKRLRILEEPRRDAAGKIVNPAVLEFDYLGLAVNYIDGHVRLNLDDAREFGAIYGCCVRCGRTLTLEESIEAGLGTTCITYFQAA